MEYLNLLINPGSTSTKFGVAKGENILFSKSIRHSQAELAPFATINDQKAYRIDLIVRELAQAGYHVSDFDGMISIGGRLHPCQTGVYLVGQDMLDDLTSNRYHPHACNLGAIIADTLSREAHCKAYVADPPTSDELDDVARLSGIPELERYASGHPLNQKRMARKAARELGKPYEESRLVVVHLGGGISVTAHRGGKMVDSNVPRGEGPFCIDRAGGVNAYELARLCFSGKYSKEEALKKISGNGGVVAYLGTRDFKEVVSRCAAGDKLAKSVFDAMAYQVAKEIGAASVAAHGAELIVLTGGMAYSDELVRTIQSQVSFLAPVVVYPGEEELEALAEYIHLAQNGGCTVQNYIKDPVTKGDN